MSCLLPFRSVREKEWREKKKKKRKKQRNVTGGRRTSRKRENKRGCGRAEIRGVHVLTIISFVIVVVVVDALVGHRRYIIIIIIIIIVGVYDSLPITASVTGIKRNYVILYCGLTIVRSLSVVSLFLHDFLI